MTRRFPFVLGLMLAAAGSSPAAFTIDNFNNPTPAVFFNVNPPAGPSINPLTLTHPTGQGSTRNSTIQVDVPPSLPPGTSAVTGIIGYEPAITDGVFDFNSNTFAQVRAILQYNGFAGGSVDLSNTLYLTIAFRNLDPGINVANNQPALDIPLDVAISTTSGNYFGSFMLPGSAVPYDYTIPYSALAGSGDLSQVTSLLFTFNGGPNQRQRTDFLLTGIEAVPSPVPPTAFLALFGVPLLARLRRRRG